MFGRATITFGIGPHSSTGNTFNANNHADNVQPFSSRTISFITLSLFTPYAFRLSSFCGKI